MLSQRCKLTIDDEKYEIKVNVGSMIEVEQLTGKQFMEIVDSIETAGIFLYLINDRTGSDVSSRNLKENTVFNDII